MDNVSLKALPGAGAVTKTATTDPALRERDRLRKATRDFEAFFMTYMLKTMRETIPKSEEPGAMDNGLGKDVFASMFDQKLGETMAQSSRRGIGDLLYDKLVSRLTAETSSRIETRPLPLRAEIARSVGVFPQVEAFSAETSKQDVLSPTRAPQGLKHDGDTE